MVCDGTAVIDGIEGTDGIGIVGTDVMVEPCGNGDAEATAARARAKTKVFIVRSWMTDGRREDREVERTERGISTTNPYYN